MPDVMQNSRVIRFAPFEADLRSRELRKHGLRLKLQDQPFQVLAMLLERPGELVTRDEIRAKLWPEDTFVDFDHGLNAAVRRLREALNDSAETPRFVETLPRRGYRFIGHVEQVATAAATAVTPPAQAPEHSAQPVQAQAADDDNPSVPAARPPGAAPRWPWVATAILVVAVAAVFVARWRFRSPSINSLAVLPFVSAEHNPDLDYLGDGIAESVINTLSQVPGLRVMSRNSAFRYRQSSIAPRQVGHDLGVGALLMGSIRSRGDDLRIDVELVDASDEHQLWGEQYTRKMSDLTGLQGEIASEVSQRLRLRLAQPVQSRLARRDTENSEAYRLYLRGKFAMGARTNRDIEEGLQYFQRAVELDPSYAAPYAGMATGYGLLAFYGGMAPKQAMPLEAAAAKRSLALDPDFADAHMQHGFYLEFPKLQIEAAEAEFLRAIELSPNSEDAHHGYSLFLMQQGRFDEAIRQAKLVLELDPLWGGSYGSLANIYHLAGRNDEALAEGRKAREHAPSQWVVGLAYEAKGDFPHAIEKLEQAVALGRGGFAEADLAHAYAAAGDTAKARAMLARLLQRRNTEYFSAYKIATVYAGLNQDAEVFRWLAIACDEMDPWMPRVRVDNAFAKYRNRPEIAELHTRLEKIARDLPD